MKSILTAVLVTTTLFGCGRISKPVDFKESVPGDSFMTVKAPESSTRALHRPEGDRTAAQGDTSGLYGLTVLGAVAVNGTTLIVLGGLRDVMARVPTSIAGNVATYGPHTPALSPTTWKLTVTRTADNAFSYVLEGKPKAEDDTSYRTAMSGNHVVSLDANGDAMHDYGHGSFLVEWGDSPSTHGEAQFDYARDTVDSDITLTVAVTGADGGTANYAYSQAIDDSGTLDFVAQNSSDRWSIRSRWLATGDGRSDVKVTGDNYSTPATMTECWNSSFASTYLVESWSPSAGWGSESSCAFDTADYSAL